jgi:hypothetical protein
MPVEYITVGPGTLTIGETAALMDFSSQCTACKLTPSVDNGDPINVLSGEQVAGDRSESFTLDGTFLQELGEDSSTEWLFTHRGETHPFVYVPATDKGRQVTGNLVVEAIDIGGDVKTKPTSDFSFIIVGSPAIAAVAPALAKADASL